MNITTTATSVQADRRVLRNSRRLRALPTGGSLRSFCPFLAALVAPQEVLNLWQGYRLLRLIFTLLIRV